MAKAVAGATYGGWGHLEAATAAADVLVSKALQDVEEGQREGERGLMEVLTSWL